LWHLMILQDVLCTKVTEVIISLHQELCLVWTETIQLA
jgi:hypothetical protein